MGAAGHTMPKRANQSAEHLANAIHDWVSMAGVAARPSCSKVYCVQVFNVPQ